MDFAVIVAIPFVLGVSTYFLRDRLRPVQQGLLLSAGMSLLFVFLLVQLPRITEQGALEFVAPWIPQIGLTFALYVDGLGLLFGLLVTGIGSAVMLYTGCYMDDARQAGRFFALMLAFTGSMLAVVLAGNVVVLFIAWELTSVISFLLIGFKGADDEARRGALQSLMITGGGGLALFVGLLLLGNVAGTMQLGEILSNGEALRQHPWYGALTGLILLGCFSKSAQFPLHFWLPQAMNAPTPASAFLHSATMVKAGVYLLARLYPALGDTALWNGALSAVGLATMLVGAVLALRQRDLKGILAYTTISQLGALVALIGQPEAAGLKAAAVGIVAHALYKGALFLIAGAVDHTTGTRNINELGGIGRRMRGLAAATAIAGLSMAGVPPLLGFVAKETLLEAVIQQPLTLSVVTVSAALTVTAALRLFWDVFMGAPRTRLPQPEHVPHDRHHPFGDDAFDYSCCHDLPPLMLASPGALATLSVIAGVALAPLMAPLVSAAIGKQVSLYLFPPSGVNLALVLSGVALALGVGVFAVRRVWLKWSMPVSVSGVQVYDETIRAVESVGDVLLKMQSGRIRYYLAVILFSVLVLLATAVPNIRIDLPTPAVQLTTAAHVLEAILLVLALAATLASILFERHLVAALALGIAGYAIGGMFLLEPAPDVALVQFLVETLATVLIIIILARTSQDERRRAMARLWGQTRRGLVRDLAVSIAMGAAVAIFALAAVSSRPTPDAIAAWHLANALPQAGVNDVVAGILTDFRGTDTLIEITVFGVATLGVLTLLARPRPTTVMPIFRRRATQGERAALKAALEEDAERPDALVYRSQFVDPITRLAAALVMPIALLIALAHILYGGVSPGDGFTAGVISGLGIALWYVVFGYAEARRRLGWLRPAPLVGIGLVIAIGNAMLPLAFGREFLALTQVTGISFANIKLASSLVFETGIFLTVLGGVSAILEAINHPKEVESL